jgi:PKD repeat protein
VKRLIFGLLLVILLAGTVGCSSHTVESTPSPRIMAAASTVTSGKVVAVPAPATYTIAAPAVEQIAPSLGGLFHSSSDSSGTAPSPVISATPDVTFSSYAADETPNASGERMIIRNGSLQLVVKDVAEALKQITDLAGAYGGFVVNSNIQESQSRLYGNISVRVESKRFNEALAALRALAEDVKSESTSGQDVTEEYTDLTANLRNLQAAESQLLELMKKAGTVTEILGVQKELVTTRGEIEQTKGRMQYLEQSSDLALIQVGLEQSSLSIEFTATARNIKTGTKIYFVPTITGGFQPYSYVWDFGDGSTSTEGAPQHAYKKTGTYSVSVKISDDHGNTVSLKRDNYINVISGWEAGNTAHSAWNGFVTFMHFLLDLLTWIGIFSPVWVVVLVVLYFAVWRRRKKNK